MEGVACEGLVKLEWFLSFMAYWVQKALFLDEFFLPACAGNGVHPTTRLLEPTTVTLLVDDVFVVAIPWIFT